MRMGRNLAITGLLVVGLLAGAAALAGPMEDVILQYSGDFVAVRNNGTNRVAAMVTRICTPSSMLSLLRFPQARRFRVVAGPGEVVRVDRDRNGSCTYVITDARYIGSIAGTVR